MSITLSIPPAVVQEARAYAAENGTTMSRMIREYFTGLVMPKPERRDGDTCRFLSLPEVPMFVFQRDGASTGMNATKGPLRNDLCRFERVRICA